MSRKKKEETAKQREKRWKGFMGKGYWFNVLFGTRDLISNQKQYQPKNKDGGNKLFD